MPVQVQDPLDGSGFLTNAIAISAGSDHSLALKADGTPHAKMDNAQAKGMPAPECAERIVRAIEKEKAEVLIAGKERLVVHLKRWAPWAYHWVIRRINTT